MGTSREDLDFEIRLEAESIFIYYLTGTLALVFFITLCITRSLQRTQPMVTELIHDSNITEDLVTYLITIETSIWPGRGCPNGVKVYIQLMGMHSTSQYFLLQSKGSSKAILKRGYTDIFLVKVPVSLGNLSSVKFILSGLKGPLKWTIRRVELHKLSTGAKLQLPASIVVTERCEPNTYHKVLMGSDCRGVAEKVLVYHQWLGQFGNTVRYGAFTAVTHVICIFTTLTLLLDLTLTTYILLPGEGDLLSLPLLIGTISPAFGCCLILFIVEVVLRNVKSMMSKPGNAYYTLRNENRNMNAVCNKSEEYDQVPCIINKNDFDKQLVWDSNFRTITRFLTKFLGYLNSDSDFLRFRNGAQDYRMFQSAYSSKANAPTLYVPKYSGMALNHLLGESNSQGDVKRSSLLNLIQNQSPIHSLTSLRHDSHRTSDEAISVSVVGSKHTDNKRLAEKKSNRTLEECSVDSNLFWKQYKNRKQSSKQKRVFDNISAFGQDSYPDLSNEAGYRYQKDSSDLKLASHTYNEKYLPDAQQGTVRNRKPSNLIKHGDVAHQGKAVDKSDNTSFVIDIDSKDKENEDELQNLGKEESVEIDLPVGAKYDIRLQHDRKVILKQQDTEEVKIDLDDEVKIDLPDDDGEDFCSVRDNGDEENDEDYFSVMSSEESLISKRRSYAPDLKSVNWESINKSRSRKLVTDICKFFRKVRIQVIEGEVIHVLPVIVDWFDDVISSIILACFTKCKASMEDITTKRELVNLTMYMSGEIILFTMNQVYTSLKSGNMDLPDIVVQSHHLMLAVEEASFSLLFALNNDFLDRHQAKVVRTLEMQRYVCHICTEFIKQSFQLIVHANELTWAYFEIYVLQTLKKSIDPGTFQDLMKIISNNLQNESEETVILQKLCKTAIEEAKSEVWEEYHDEKNMFIDMTVKQNILAKLTSTRHQILQRKKRFDEEYKLSAKPPKSRLQILAEKRKKVNLEQVQKKTQRENSLGKWLLWERETGCQTVPSHAELIRHSMFLEVGASNLKLMKEQAEKKWVRLGLKSHTQGLLCLVHSLMYGYMDMDGVPEATRFTDYLQVKRVENNIEYFIQQMLEELSQYIIVSVVELYNLMEFPNQKELKLSMEDLCIRVDIMKDLLYQELETIAEYALSIERRNGKMDENLIQATTRMIIQRSSNLLNCSPSLTDDFMVAKRPGRTTSINNNTPTQYRHKKNKMVVFNKTPELNQTELKALKRSVLSVGELKKDLMMIQLFLKDFTQTENMRKQCTLLGYFERQKRKCSRIANIALHNVIDSYYIIEEGDDSHTFTKAGLYQIEHDLMGESKKKFPHYLKTLLTGFLLLVILSSFVWVTLVGSQFDTAQNQEFVLHYIISVFQFALVFEPFRAIAVASLCRRKD